MPSDILHTFHPSISVAPTHQTLLHPTAPIKPSFALHTLQTDEETTQKSTTAKETTQKYGLEAGLFQSFQSQDGESAKCLLAKYSIAYITTSIQLVILSLALCYMLVNRGVNVGALLSLILFPPSVLLMVVANLTGKEVEEGGERE
ncbi:hypothetical protein HJC23_012300 [Cyclotella cryptica]|uniref:DUF1279 domain-containing protein n=1 Tax=Cyclotella cryptica TaxID=29204 RepID=A0ABD3PM88_9STRA|eukprot:CCRYP_013484-RA/>CCRYP_013484-RA protein AED:0.01 eAED:-0.01 QI:0/-1/0/1/-1/1/1/0/145